MLLAGNGCEILRAILSCKDEIRHLESRKVRHTPTHRSEQSSRERMWVLLEEQKRRPGTRITEGNRYGCSLPGLAGFTGLLARTKPPSEEYSPEVSIAAKHPPSQTRCSILPQAALVKVRRNASLKIGLSSIKISVIDILARMASLASRLPM